MHQDRHRTSQTHACQTYAGGKAEWKERGGTVTYAWIGLEKKLAARSSARARCGSARLGAARLGSERLASLERAEPSLFSRLAKTPSRAEPARPGTRAGSRAEAKPSNQPKLPAASPPKLHSVMNFMPFSLLLHS